MVARRIGPGYPISPPTYQPPLHGLLSSAVLPPDEPDERWQLGFEFEPDGQTPVLTHSGPICDLDDRGNVVAKATKVVQDPPPLVQYAPFQLYTSYSCPWGRTDAEREAKVRRQLAAGENKALEYELWTGGESLLGNTLILTGPDTLILNPGFDNVTPGDPATATPVDLVTALSLCGQHLADTPTGSRGMIHVTAFVGETAAAGGLWVEDGRAGTSVLRTKGRGDIIVVGSGYPNTGPGGITPATGHAWVYCSPMIHVRLGDVQIYGTGAQGMNRTSNSTWTHMAERTAAAYWDGYPAGAVLVDLAEEWLTGGGLVFGS